jgi:hypothetical protein
MLNPTPYPGSTGLYHIHKALRLAGLTGVVEGEGLGIKYFLSTNEIPSLLLLLANAFITASPSSGLSSSLSA